jgi:hypothetical protein
MTEFLLPTTERQRREWARGVLAERRMWIGELVGEDVLRMAAHILGGALVAAIDSYIARHRGRTGETEFY